VVRNLAFIANTTATFMPLPIPNEKGSALRIPISLWKDEENIFYDASEKYAQLSQNARYFIGGILEHASALSVFTAPTTNSYRKLLNDPHFIAWGRRSNGALVRVPHEIKNDRLGKSVCYMASDPSVNPHIAYAATVAAGMEGIKKKRSPGDPVEKEISAMGTKEMKDAGVKYLPSSLLEAVSELETDNTFLKGIISSDLLEDYLGKKMQEQTDNNLRTTAYEFEAYFNM
jgi:glutamine synthetase